MSFKRHVIFPIILTAIISFFLGVLITNQYYKTNSINSLTNGTFPVSPEPISKYSSGFGGEHKSPWDESKKVIVKGDEFNGYEIVVPKETEQIKVMPAIGPQAFTWNYRSDKVAFVDHEVSNHDSVHIISLDVGNHAQADGEEQFLQSQQNPSDYSHVYTRIFGWYDNDNLIVSVSGHPDSSDFQPKSQLFIVNVNSGKVIKRVL